ncbi:MAG: hypothetical protein WA996_26245 [Candidatus Promineifilaceae bacterium]
MAFFKSSEQFCTCAQILFDRLLTQNPQAAKPVEKAKLLMLFRCTDPTVSFLINGRRRPATVEFGRDKIRPEIDADLSTDALHLILLGDLPLSEALSTNSIKVRGSVWKLTSLATLFQECQILYPDILREQGLLV